MTLLLIIYTLIIVAIVAAAIIFVKKYFLPLQQKMIEIQQTQKDCSVATFHARIPQILDKIEDLPSAQILVHDLEGIATKMNNNYNLHHAAILSFSRRLEEFEKFFLQVKNIIEDFQHKDDLKHDIINQRLIAHDLTLTEHTRDIRAIKKHIQTQKNRSHETNR